MIRLYDMLDLRRIERRHRRECSMLGSFGFGAGGRCGKAAASTYDPSLLALMGWWRASYSPSTWGGTFSAGNSGSHSLTHATNAPSGGGVVNGFTPAQWISANSDLLQHSGAYTNFVSASAFTIICLIKTSAQPADAGAGAPYDQCQVFGTEGGSINVPLLTYSTAGFGAGFYDGSTWSSVRVAAGTGTWHMVKARLSGGTLGVGLGSGAMSTIARGNVNASSSTTIRVGQGDSGGAGVSKFLDAEILELMVIDSALSDATINTDIRGYFNNRYALSIS